MRLWIISCLLVCAVNGMAQTDTVDVMQDTVMSKREMEMKKKIEGYEKRLDRYHRFFHSLVPEFVRFQYAGSIGLVNAGLGWDYGKKEQWETDLMFGYIPKYDKEAALMSFTVRQTYVPWRKPIYGDIITFQPLACGAFVNSVLNSEYWTREPDRYPNGSYYRFSSKLRFHVFLGQRYTFSIPEHKRKLARQVSFVWELSSCDLYIISKAVNHTLPWHEILSLSLGLKYDF